MGSPRRVEHDLVNHAISKITSDLKHQLIDLFGQIADSQTDSVAKLQERQEALLKENDRLRGLLESTDACVPAAEYGPGDTPVSDRPSMQWGIKSPRLSGPRSHSDDDERDARSKKSHSRNFDDDERDTRSKYGGDMSTKSMRSVPAFELLPFWQKVMNPQEGMSPPGHRSFRWSVSRRTKLLKVECQRTTSGMSKMSSLVATNPMSYKRLAWEGIGVALVVYDLIMTPLEFFDVLFRPMMYFIASYWTLEMFSSFLVGYQDRGVLEFRVPKVVKRYLRTWFCSDLVLVISDWILVVFDTLEQSNRVAGLDYLQIGRIVRALRFLRLVRLLRLHSFVGRIYEYFQSPYVLTLFAVSKFICFILILAHFVACGWYGLGVAVQLHGNGKSWIEENFRDSDRFWFRYSTSLHWSLTQFTPASMEVVPVNAAERIYACLTIAVAMVVFSSFISAITEAMTQVRKAYSKKNEQDKELRRYFTDNSISHQLAIRIWKYFEHGAQTKRQRKTWKDVDLFNQLPPALQQDLHYEVYLPIIQWHPMFEVYSDRNAAAARAVCHKVVEELIISDNHKLFAMGEAADRMFFVTEGALAYHLGGDGIEPREKVFSPPVPVYPDQWVSEAAMWLRWFHQGDMIPQQATHVVMLHAVPLQEVLQQYVDMLWECLTYAKLFQQYAEATEDISDLQGDISSIQRMVDQAFPTEGGEISRDNTDSLGSCEPFKRPSLIQNILQIGPAGPGARRP